MKIDYMVNFMLLMGLVVNQIFKNVHNILKLLSRVFNISAFYCSNFINNVPTQLKYRNYPIITPWRKNR